MKKPSRKFVVLAVIVGAIASCSLAWSTAYPSGTWRYKITVSVDTPEGIKTGSAVREVMVVQRENPAPDRPRGKATVKGEAVVIDLGKRGVLFSIIKGDDYRHTFKAFPYSRGGTTPEGVEYYSHLKNAKAELPNNLFQLVRFKDLKDPASVLVVDPDDLPASFGEGVALRNVIIEMTDDQITSGGVNKYLPWLNTLLKQKTRLNGRKGAISTNDVADNLGAGSFKMGKE